MEYRRVVEGESGIVEALVGGEADGGRVVAAGEEVALRSVAAPLDHQRRRRVGPVLNLNPTKTRPNPSPTSASQLPLPTTEIKTPTTLQSTRQS